MNDFKLLLDEPIEDINKDKFGHEHYADVLFSLIINEEFKKNYNIGLLGTWGVGKSSIKEFCQKKLKIKSSNSNQLVNNIYTIDFNAWKYGSEGIKRALLKHLYVKLGGEYDTFLDKLSRQIHKDSKTIEEIKNLITDVRGLINHKLSLVLIISCLVLLILSIVLIFKPSLAWLLAIVNTGIVTIISMYAGLFKNISLFPNLKKIDLPKTTAEEFEELLKNQIKNFKNPDLIADVHIDEKNKINKLIKDIGIDIKNKLKIVIFIDDLDRLPSKEMVEGINAIRTFMDLDLPEDVNIIFVISCCENKIADALQTINFEYEKTDKENLEKMIEAKRFLDKIFQFRIDIPPFPYRDMVEYTRSIITKQLPSIENELLQKGISIENLLCRLIHPRVQNPRQAIQITNAFLQSWHIANIRENTAANKTGGLAQHAVTKHPIPLAVLSVLKIDYPYFYHELQNEPKLLKYLFSILNNDNSDIPLNQRLVNEFVEEKIIEFTNVEKVKVTKIIKIIKEKYRDLEWYLNSIKDVVDFPSSIKPLLLLNQDTVTRQFDNDDATNIEEALSSRAVKDIISLFGLKDNKLTYEQTNLLNSVMGQIDHYVYKETAYLTIIDLIEFMNKDNNSNFILDGIVNVISNNKSLRTKIKLEQYKNLLATVKDNIQDQVINLIKANYLSNLVFSIPSDDDDSEEQNKVYENAKEAALILIDFFAQNEIKQDIESLKWLIEPIDVSYDDDIPTPKESHSEFDFSFINECFTQNDFLLKYLGLEYSNKFLSEIQTQKAQTIKFKAQDETIDVNKEIGEHIDISNSLLNIEKLLNLTIETNKNNFIEIVKKYLAFEYIKSFEFITNYLIENFDKLDDDNKDLCLLYLCKATVNELDEEILYVDNNPDQIIQFIIEKVKTNADIIKDETFVEIAEFTRCIHKLDEYIDDAISYYELLKTKNVDICSLEESFIEYNFDDPRDNQSEHITRKYLAQNYLKLNQNSQISLIEKLKELVVVNANEVISINKQVFDIFLKNIPVEAFANNNVISLFDHVYEDIISKICPDVQGAYLSYYSNIFPIIKDYVKYSKSQFLSEMLFKLCQNNTYGIGTGTTFDYMSDLWEQLDKIIWQNNDYAQQIYDLGISCIDQRFEEKVFFSVEKLIKNLNALQNDDNLNKLFTKSYKLWINNEGLISEILISYDMNCFTMEQFYTLGLNTSADKEEQLIKVWTHLIKYLENQNKEFILKTLFAHDLNKFVIFGNVLKVNKDISIVIQVIIDLIKVDYDMVISNKDNITNNIFSDGKHRKGLSLKLLDLLLSTPNESLAYWAKDLYNDIMKFVKISKFKDNQEAINIINKVFYPNNSVQDEMEEPESN